MRKLYVTGDAAVFVPGYGERAPGEYFEMPDDEAGRYAQRDGFSLKAPRRPVRDTTATTVAEPEEDAS